MNFNTTITDQYGNTYVADEYGELYSFDDIVQEGMKPLSVKQKQEAYKIEFEVIDNE